MTQHYPKKPCPTCGVEISSYPAHWKGHIAKCSAEPVKESAPVEEPVMEATETQPKVKTHGTPVDEETARLIAVAQEKEAEYNRAPEAYVISENTNDHLELRKIYAPETFADAAGQKTLLRDKNGKVTKKPERHAFVCDGKKIKAMVHQGYIPKLDEHGNMVTTAHGDILCTIPYKRYEAQQAAYAKKSRVKMAAAEKKAQSVGTAPSDVTDGMMTDAVTIEKAESFSVGE